MQHGGTGKLSQGYMTSKAHSAAVHRAALSACPTLKAFVSTLLADPHAAAPVQGMSLLVRKQQYTALLHNLHHPAGTR